MSNHVRRPASSLASTRRGAAFLLLVVMVLIVIVSATQWLVTGSVTYRKAENQRLRARSMIAAMDQAQSLAADDRATLRLPIDDEHNERIEITPSTDGSSLTAIWLHGETEFGRLIRPIRQADPNHSADDEH